ncbi:thymidylate kinase [Candidatus Uhrbacteria bacterium CG10_big_fil_rev_8_21_14_0_10_48_11]|uniref:Thymidylate kinase n=1 Tax=Candidatus Uhrbacteria bacterium CG10_big_fil_rev_8_21_14_0_10_48_11 TaxID=1975037 RepID=A0A2M8LE49_9BACT|nr:MAG: thymidylate kinase [Candidatus Uhrbacteria bacterium CG10_big_fil_rev_8_21_14_0_10_48_11]
MTKISSSVKLKKKRAGRLIVIDGTDGTGKATQTALLVKKLRAEGKKVAIADFPRYGLPSAYFVEQYLNGRYGSAKDIPPQAASLFYALDRFDAKQKMIDQLNDGYIIVSNRFVTANMGHQGGKIISLAERKKFFSWLDWLEHDLLGLPRPDLTILLHVPAALAQRLIDRKGRRAYIQGKRDLHEDDLGHLKAAEKTYLEIANLFPKFILVECLRNKSLLSPDEIHQAIWKKIERLVS